MEPVDQLAKSCLTARVLTHLASSSQQVSQHCYNSSVSITLLCHPLALTNAFMLACCSHSSFPEKFSLILHK